MIKILKKTVLIYFFINLVSTSFGNENFFDKGLELYKNKKYDDARSVSYTHLTLPTKRIV